jgi:tetratricopeptide (TPR) repeat protein
MDNKFDELDELFKQKEYQTVLNIVDDMIFNGETDIKAYQFQALALESLGRYTECIDILNKMALISPNDADVYSLRSDCKLYLDPPDYSEALKDINIALKINDNNDLYFYKKAKIFFFKANYQNQNVDMYKKALEEINIAILIQPTDLNYYFLRGDIKIGLDLREGALLDFEFISLVHKDNISLYQRISSLKFELGYTEEALEYLEKALKIAPNNIDILIQKAEIHRIKKDFENALQDLKKVITIDEENLEALLLLSNIENIVENYKESLYYSNKILNIDDKNYALYIELGYSYMKLEQFDLALENLSKAITIDSSDHTGVLYKAQVYEKMEDYQKALDNYLLANSIYGNNISLLTSIADCYYNLKDYKSAIPYYNASILMYLGSEENYIKRGLCKLEVEEPLGAYKDFYTVLMINPENIEALKLTADVCRIYFEEYSLALENYEKLYDLGIKNYHIYQGIIESCINSENLEKSLIYAKEFLDQDPKNSFANYYYGKTLVSLDKKDEAKTYLLRAKLNGHEEANLLLTEMNMKL